MTREAGWRYGIISTVMVSYLRLWYHIYGYGIISTVPYEQQKIYRQIILFQRIYYLSISLTGLQCHREPSIVLMSMAHTWWSSKSWTKDFSALKARMVVSPCRDVLRWENTGLRAAGQTIYYYNLINLIYYYYIIIRDN